jgi:hypothetical protein
MITLSPELTRISGQNSGMESKNLIIKEVDTSKGVNFHSVRNCACLLTPQSLGWQHVQGKIFPTQIDEGIIQSLEYIVTYAASVGSSD